MQVTSCVWQSQWDSLDPTARGQLKAQQDAFYAELKAKAEAQAAAKAAAAK